ncbi:peptidoglycan DD-metalloendopeptidase family protein [Phormidium sp. FACHB-592]|uniref:Peptidoglycan DD-metalloendopeptidase family protein n=1 Tax=Stenomitos frigidus AS-A4 TaxID=2933935 RepID=A0ABV0KFS7_9CYAN|nr:peptidoglycan DD-metalloendopeptidase family protein [Phormidium sp. FACHB-592]MBD2076692.1 peptidoglycan DD-metalloendopeptidase family protein [Phormidium sp. FACHB-592]
MERTFPQKVKPVPSCEVEDGVNVSQIRQAPSEVNRLVRTSAAMIGLAISVGTCSLPLPGQSDEAVAAEPVIGEAAVGEPNASALPPKFDVAAISTPTEATDQAQNLSPSGAIEHAVQEGQTLWQLAQLYQVDAAALALENGISVNSVLHVGQVLKIQGSGQVAPITPTVDVASVSGGYGSVNSAATEDSDRPAATQASDKEALDTLHQKQERLRLSLAQLESSRKTSAPVTAPESVAEVAAPSSEASYSEASYKVVLGDTLEAIAKVHGVSLKQLSEANRLVNPDVLNVGQVLVVPQTSESASPVASATAPVMIASASPEQMTLPASISRPQVFSQAKTAPSTQGKFQPASSAQVGSDRLRGIAVLPSQSSQLTAVDQTIPAVSLNHSPIAPVAIGGANEVATSSFVGNQGAQAAQTGSSAQQSYVENLRLEIVKLREKYQGSVSQIDPAAPSTKVAASSLNVAAPANAEATASSSTELQPSRYTKALQAQIRQLQDSHQQGNRAVVKPAAATPVAPSKPQLIATASIGAENYEPLVRSATGQMVSPDLPPLGSVDAYLPGKSDKFNGYIWPAKGVLTSGYGYRWGRMHKGIDIAAPVGTPIFAAAAGVVISAGWNSGGYGYLVKIQHPDGSVTLYAHNNRIIVREGQTVAQGQQIADMGSTGYSTGPHSHFEVHRPGQGAVNPTAYLPRGQA